MNAQAAAAQPAGFRAVVDQRHFGSPHCVSHRPKERLWWVGSTCSPDEEADVPRFFRLSAGRMSTFNTVKKLAELRQL